MTTKDETKARQEKAKAFRNAAIEVLASVLDGGCLGGDTIPNAVQKYGVDENQFRLYFDGWSDATGMVEIWCYECPSYAKKTGIAKSEMLAVVGEMIKGMMLQEKQEEHRWEPGR